ncbi:MAG: SET domain-containing protein-lysine N-methyltransferase [Nanoarchaeota archaeon]
MDLPILIVKQSRIDNLGLFAETEIPAKTLIIEYTGEKITGKEADKREMENDKKGATYIFCLNENCYVDGAVDGNQSKYLNHSCDPNCDIVMKKGRIFFYSSRLIKIGEELTIDYSYDADSKKEKCDCGCDNCRGFINEA